MKRIKLIIEESAGILGSLANSGIRVFVMAFAIGLAVVSCNKDKDKDDDDPKDDAAGVAVSQYTKPADYTAGALEKMKSLGKTEKDKRLVTCGGNSDETVYIVHNFEGGACTGKLEYNFCKANCTEAFFTAASYLADEVNETDKWTLHSYSHTGTWQSMYDAAKQYEHLGNKVIE
jgi:hypothetical protein